MEDEAAVIYGLEFQARCLTAQLAETEAIRYFVGTQSLKCDNQIHQIDYDEETNVISKSVFMHRVGEVWHIAASPKQKDILSTSYSKLGNGKCEMESAIWKLPSEYESGVNAEDSTSQAPSLELLCQLESEDMSGEHKGVIWHPSDGQQIVSLVDNQIYLWDLVESGSQAKIACSWALEGKSHTKLTTGTWNPHQNCTQIATASDTCIRGWDLRSQRQAYAIENAHGILVRDMEFNPNKQYYLASCGDDCKVKFWDVRNMTEPLKILCDHSHWVWRVRYNHFHDQLVLTSSSDSCVILSSVASISSEPFGHLLEDEPVSDDDGIIRETEKHLPAATQDCVISTYEEHEDSVYAIEWSSADPWLFASLSYDGRLIINQVPKAVKYKILL